MTASQLPSLPACPNCPASRPALAAQPTPADQPAPDDQFPSLPQMASLPACPSWPAARHITRAAHEAGRASYPASPHDAPLPGPPYTATHHHIHTQHQTSLSQCHLRHQGLPSRPQWQPGTKLLLPATH